MPDANIGWDTCHLSPPRFLRPYPVRHCVTTDCGRVSNNQPPAHTEVTYLILWEGLGGVIRGRRERCGRTGGEAFIPSTPALMPYMFLWQSDNTITKSYKNPAGAFTSRRVPRTSSPKVNPSRKRYILNNIRNTTRKLRHNSLSYKKFT